jgi:hypothetical protein
MILAALASLILWPLYLCLFLPLAIIGAVILAPLSLFRMHSYRPSRFEAFRGPLGEDKVAAWWGGWLTWLWGNEEDGVNGPLWWRNRTGVLPSVSGVALAQRLARAWSTYRWSAHRNPVNNLRFLPVVCPTINPTRIRSKQWDNGFFCWQGVYAGVMHFPVIRGRVFRFWLGWKLKPEDAQGVPAEDFRATGCGLIFHKEYPRQ